MSSIVVCETAKQVFHVKTGKDTEKHLIDLIQCITAKMFQGYWLVTRYIFFY